MQKSPQHCSSSVQNASTARQVGSGLQTPLRHFPSPLQAASSTDRFGTHSPLLHAWQTGQGDGQSTDWLSLACFALCFLAFLRHFFLASPDFFLHLAFRSWAAASS